MSHGFPKRLRRRREKHRQLPKLTQTKPAAKESLTSGIITDLARPISSRAFDEALRESQTKTNI